MFYGLVGPGAIKYPRCQSQRLPDSQRASRYSDQRPQYVQPPRLSQYAADGLVVLSPAPRVREPASARLPAVRKTAVSS